MHRKAPALLVMVLAVLAVSCIVVGSALADTAVDLTTTDNEDIFTTMTLNDVGVPGTTPVPPMMGLRGSESIASVPVADFSALPTSGNAPLDVQFTDGSTNSPTWWSWNFGDNPVNVYVTDLDAGLVKVIYPNGTVGVLAGGHTFTLPSGIDVDAQGNIYVVEYAGTIYKILPDDTLTTFFAGGSGVTGVYDIAVDRNGNVYIADADGYAVKKIDPSGTVTTLLSFGGGVPTPQNVDVDALGNVYTAEGSYNQKIYKIFPNGTSVELGGSVATGLAVDYNGTVYFSDINNIQRIFSDGTRETLHSYVMAQQSVAIDDFTGNLYSTDFYPSNTPYINVRYANGTVGTLGSGFTNPFGIAVRKADSIAQNPSHTYAAPGTYGVTLIAANADGANLLTKTGYITANAAGVVPVANFTANVTTGSYYLPVQFTDNSTGADTWAWDFGDGNTSSAQNPYHLYATAGSFTVNLTVTNAAGQDSEEKLNYITVTEPAPPVPGPLPGNRHIFIGVANDEGVKFNLDDLVYGPGGYNAYYVKSDSGGLNELHVTNSTDLKDGQVNNTTTTSPDSSGSFYVSNTGSAGVTDDLVLLLAVNGTIPDDFSVTIRSSGYNFTPNTTVDGLPTDYVHANGTLEQTFNATDFLYGPQTWKPGPGALNTTPYMPLYFGQDQADGQTYHLMFVDLRVGALNATMIPGLVDNGFAKVEYSFHNMTSRAAFDIYGWRQAAAQGQGISWTNKVSGSGSSGYTVLYEPLPPVANFTASITSGCVPLFVRFNDTSENIPTSWLWDFGDGGNSTGQNVTHTYMAEGTYTVNLTATNAGGSDSEVKTGLITVTPPVDTWSGYANSAWPKSGHDPRNTGLSPYVGSQSGTPKWVFAFGTNGAFSSTVPLIGPEGTIYINDNRGDVYAINPDGTQKWIYYASGGSSGGPLAMGADGTLYFGDAYPRFYAVNPNGTLKWVVTVSSIEMDGPPAIGSDGTLYLGGDKFYAIFPENGSVKWSYPTGPIYAFGTPAIGTDGTIYVGSGDKNLYAINPDGTLKWSCLTNGAIRDAPAIGSDGTIYFGNYGNKSIDAVNPDGTMKWSYKVLGSTDVLRYNNPAIGPDGTIYIGNYANPDKNLYAMNPNGTLKWKHLFTSPPRGTPTIGADGTIYITVINYWVYALNPADGSEKWSYNTPSTQFWTTPSIAPDGTVYFASYSNRRIYAFPGVVDFTANKTTGSGPLDVQFNGTSPLTVTVWHWDFGDGSNSTEQNPLHTYSAAGNYSVNLTITHANGTNYLARIGYIMVRNIITIGDVSMNEDGTGTATIVLDKAPTGLRGFKLDLNIKNSSVSDNLTFVTYPAGFNLFDTKGSTWPGAVYTNDVDTLAEGGLSSGYIRAVDGPGASFPAGSTNILLATVTLHGLSLGSTTLDGTLVTLTDSAGADLIPLTAIQNGTINVTTVPPTPPIANFTANVTSGRVPLAVQFNDTSTGNPTSWNWTFGDGDLLCPFGDSQNPAHNYRMPGTYTVNLTASNANGSDDESKAGFITVLPQSLAGKIAVYRNGSWYLDSDDSGTWNAGDAVYGFGSAGWEKVVGDWDGDGDREIGVYQAGTWYLDENGDGGFTAGDTYYRFGAAGWQPVLGDWNGDRSDEIAVYRDGIWYLDVNGDGLFDAGDRGAVFGAANWTPVVGDWNGNGIAEIGVYRDGVWYLDLSGDGLFGDGDAVYFFGGAGWTPVVGNWDGDGATEIGVYNAGAWYLDTNGDGAFTADDLFCGFGAAGWTPVIGDWDSDGSHEVGVYQDSIWYVDLNGDGRYSFGDIRYRFGAAGWDPVVW